MYRIVQDTGGFISAKEANTIVRPASYLPTAGRLENHACCISRTWHVLGMAAGLALTVAMYLFAQ
jgi:hypothetical protein